MANVCAHCSVPISRGAKFCRKHKSNGPIPIDEQSRFWSSVETAGDDDCWVWAKSKDRKGYGKFGVGSMKDGTRRIEQSSRTAWRLTNGPIPDGLFVCHSCDNPPCCNPRHLWLGTCKENLQDMHAKGRFYAKSWTDKEKIKAIKILGASKTIEEIANEIDVQPSFVSKVLRGASFKHIE